MQLLIKHVIIDQAFNNYMKHVMIN